MGSNFFLNNANRTIGDTARYLRQFQANGQAASGSTKSNGSDSDGMSQMMDALNPVLLVMLFQMMSQMMTQGGYGLPAANYAPPLPSTTGNTGASPPPPPPPTQNPAYTALQTLLTSDTNSATITFEDNTSIQTRLDAIFANRSQAIQDLAYSLKSLSPDSPEAAQAQSRIKQLLTADGGNAPVIQELDLLWQAEKVNHQIPLLEIQATGTPSEALTAQITALKQTRAELAQQWQALPETNGGSSTKSIVALIKTALQNKTYNESQLGSCLKYLLDQAPAGSIERITGLISDLMENGTLNIAPFLYNDYLERLTPERRQALLYAVEESGLVLGTGKPNSRFIGFILENLGKPGNGQTKAFLRQFLRDFYRVHGQTPQTTVGALLAQVIALGGLEVDDQGQLVFPE